MTASLMIRRSRLGLHHRAIDEKHDDRADHRDEQAPEVEAGDALMADQAEQESADQRADHAEGDVHQKAFAGLVDDFAGDESGDESENDPGDDSHSPPLAGERRARPKNRARFVPIWPRSIRDGRPKGKTVSSAGRLPAARP